MRLTGAVDVASTMQSIELFDKDLIDIGLKDGRKAYSLILEVTVYGSERLFSNCYLYKSFFHGAHLFN